MPAVAEESATAAMSDSLMDGLENGMNVWRMVFSYLIGISESGSS
jgi:hypothetical protein